ncbi:MAG: hypothetical protein H7338_21720 [Candidatus Sericytochromatia bacterium]|nr:hypothetical protein [Candidatus Sericytochromatia bacterium]
MNLNPEFQRNLWLELTLHRLIGMPLVLGGIFLLAYLSADPADGVVTLTALTLTCLFTFGWGTYLAAETVSGEIKSRTWDVQRMSSIGPWSMTWGKLFGSTIFPWYGSLICLTVYGLSAPERSLTTVVLLLLTGLMSQAVAMLASLAAVSKGQAQGRSAVIGYCVIGILSAWPLFSLYRFKDAVSWFGYPFAAIDLTLISVTLWVVWALIGCYRQMSRELQVAGTPVVWVSFLLFLWLFVAGFIPAAPEIRDHMPSLYLAVGSGVMLILTYGMVFNDRKEPAAMRRMLLAAQTGQWRRLLEDVPVWLPTLVMATVLALGLIVLLVVSPVNAVQAVAAKGAKNWVSTVEVISWIVAFLLFAARDMAIVLFFSLGARRNRADWTAGLYLAILYALVPGLLTAMGAGQLVALFCPWLARHPGTSLIAGAMQVILMAVLVHRRWQNGFGKPRVIAATPAAGFAR